MERWAAANRAADGTLYNEEVVGLEGFSGRYSILYHRYAPTRVLRITESAPLPAETDPGPGEAMPPKIPVPPSAAAPRGTGKKIR